MMFWRLVVLLITLISVFLEKSIASSVNPFEGLDNQVAPSPSPVGQPRVGFGSGTCARASNKCQDDHISMTACFFPARKAHEEQYLLVLNTGENALTLKVNVSSANETYENIQIPKHGFKQINISSRIGGSSSIMLDAGTGKCSTALLIGGLVICCKLRKQDRHDDGVAYQELEMGQPKPHSSMKLEISAEGWNESWDEDWDDEEAVKSSDGKTISIKLANG